MSWHVLMNERISVRSNNSLNRRSKSGAQVMRETNELASLLYKRRKKNNAMYEVRI